MKKANFVDMDDALKPCPFCGPSSNLNSTRDNYVACDNCDAFGPTYKYPCSAISEWNRRADLPADIMADPRVVALRDAAKMLRDNLSLAILVKNQTGKKLRDNFDAALAAMETPR